MSLDTGLQAPTTSGVAPLLPLTSQAQRLLSDERPALPATPMRIAYVTETYPPELNGVALTVERTVRDLRERGHRVTLVRPRQPGEVARRDGQEWLSLGFPIPMYPDLRYGLAFARSLRRSFIAERIELVHVATPGPLCWAAASAARSLGLAITSDFRTNFHQYSRYYRLGFAADFVLGLLRRFHNQSATTFVPTRAMRAELDAAGFERLAVVGRGVDTGRFSPAKRDDSLRASWGAGPDDRVLLVVGRVAAEKNIQLALQSFEAARAVVPNLKLVVVGDGPLRSKLEAAHRHVRFVGTQRGDDLAAHYASADAFLFASLSDTFGNVTLEALASGLPVVAFDVAAAAEYVVDGVDGRLIAADYDAAFIDATSVLLRAPAASFDAMRVAARAAGCTAQWNVVLAGFEQHLRAVWLTRHERASHVTAVA